MDVCSAVETGQMSDSQASHCLDELLAEEVGFGVVQTASVDIRVVILFGY